MSDDDDRARHEFFLAHHRLQELCRATDILADSTDARVQEEFDALCRVFVWRHPALPVYGRHASY
jgi:hypothetical protein